MQVCFALVDVGQWVVEIIFLLDLLNNFMAEGQVECFLRAKTCHISCSIIKLIRILNESLSQPKIPAIITIIISSFDIPHAKPGCPYGREITKINIFSIAGG
jgi:hypothetical protein